MLFQIRRKQRRRREEQEAIDAEAGTRRRTRTAQKEVPAEMALSEDASLATLPVSGDFPHI